jgi:NagD protein
METDILGGVQLGYRTVLVLSGGTQRADLARYAYRPDVILDSVADLIRPPSRLEEFAPSRNREDDTPLDIAAWAKLHQSPPTVST